MSCHGGHERTVVARESDLRRVMCELLGKRDGFFASGLAAPCTSWILRRELLSEWRYGALDPYCDGRCGCHQRKKKRPGREVSWIILKTGPRIPVFFHGGAECGGAVEAAYRIYLCENNLYADVDTLACRSRMLRSALRHTGFRSDRDLNGRSCGHGRCEARLPGGRARGEGLLLIEAGYISLYGSFQKR